MKSRSLEHVFVSYARVVKRGASSPLLPAVLRGIAKFAHQVNVELLLDLFANLRALLNTPGALSDEWALMCVHALLQLLSGHGAALSVDDKDVQRRLYSILSAQSMLRAPGMLATALDCVEHLCRKGRANLLAPRAASIVRRLLSLASTSPPAQAIALLCACSRLVMACPRIATMLESPEGSAPNFALLGGAVGGTDGIAAGLGALDDGIDIDSPTALHSTAWQLSELRRHYHPVVSELAAKLAAREVFPPRFLNATPLAIMDSYSDANGAFHPAPNPPKAHRLAAAATAAIAKGVSAPNLGAVPSSSMEDVRDEVALANAAAGVACTLAFAPLARHAHGRGPRS
jgi:nucleolar complex protein 3